MVPARPPIIIVPSIVDDALLELSGMWILVLHRRESSMSGFENRTCGLALGAVFVILVVFLQHDVRFFYCRSDLKADGLLNCFPCHFIRHGNITTLLVQLLGPGAGPNIVLCELANEAATATPHCVDDINRNLSRVAGICRPVVFAASCVDPALQETTKLYVSPVLVGSCAAPKKDIVRTQVYKIDTF
jgi:hypothetical protein